MSLGTNLTHTKHLSITLRLPLQALSDVKPSYTLSINSAKRILSERRKN